MSNKSTAIKDSWDRFCTKSSGSSQSINKSVTTNTPSSSKTVSTNPPQKSRKDSKSAPSVTTFSSTRQLVVKPKKTAKSDVTFNRKTDLKNNTLDFCKTCGDVASKTICGNIENLRPSSSKTIQHAHIDTRGNTFKSTKSTMHVQKVTETQSNHNINKKKSLQITVPPLRLSNTRTNFQNVKQNIQSETKNQSTLESKKQSRTVKEQQNQPTQNKPSISAVQQYYRNENFKVISESAHEIEDAKRFSLLDTIKELPEQIESDDVIDSTSDDTKLFRIYSEASEFLGSRSEPEEVEIKAVDEDFLREMKEFRDRNYFECHSSKERLRSKGSVTSLEKHKCVYRFYLNDRLFPEPLYTDTKRKIRCLDCHLPLEFNDTKLNGKNVNGTIQAKVKLGSVGQIQDMIVMLPVKNTMIIKEKRKEPKKEEEVKYFGVIKLGSDGHTVFKQHLPSDSLALKYQKGYREFENEDFRYEKIVGGDVIII